MWIRQQRMGQTAFAMTTGMMPTRFSQGKSRIRSSGACSGLSGPGGWLLCNFFARDK